MAKWIRLPHSARTTKEDADALVKEVRASKKYREVRLRTKTEMVGFYGNRDVEIVGYFIEIKNKPSVPRAERKASSGGTV